MQFTRRDFVTSAAGTAALGLSGSLAFMPSAVAQNLRKKGYYSYKIGSDIEVISIYDGIWKKPHDEGFVLGVSIDEIKQALRAGGLDDDAVPIEFAFTIVKTGSDVILIDAGTGAQLAPSAGLGNAGMAAAGVKPEDVTKVIVTHFHPDHIFGLMAKETNAQVFPNAEIFVGETEYKFWTATDLIEKLPQGRRGLAQRIQATFPKWQNVTQYNGGQEIVSGVRTEDAFGHTAGHSVVHLSSGNDEALVLSDLLNVPALFLANLDWQLVFDADKDLASKTRKEIIAKAAADNITVAGYHFGFPNSGKIEKDGSGFVFNPVSV